MVPGRRGGGRQPGGSGGGRWRRGRPLSAPGEAGAGRRRRPSSSCRLRAPRRHLLRLLPLLLLLPAGAEGQAGPSSGPHAAGPPDWPPAGPGPSLSLYLSEEEVRRLIGLDAELSYVRNDVVNHYALSFNLLIPSETNNLHFSWHAKSKVEYKLGFQVDNPMAMAMPQANISLQGEVPRTLSVFRVELSCTGRLDSEVTILMQLNLTINSSKNITVLNFKRRKMCYRSKTLSFKY